MYSDLCLSLQRRALLSSPSVGLYSPKLIPLCVLLLVLAVQLPATTFGAKINRYSSISGDFARLPHRFTTTDLDGSYYHPAGLVFGREGFGVELTLQTTHNDSTFVAGGLESSERATTWPIPSIAAAYRRGDWAFSLNLGAFGGGAARAKGRHAIFEANRRFVVDAAQAALPLFTDVSFTNSTLDAYQFYTGLFSNISFRVSDQLSLAVGAKLIDYRGRVTLRSDFDLLTATGGGIFGNRVDLNARQSGFGVGWLADLHLAPIEGLVIGLRYEAECSVETETTVDEQRLVDQRGSTGLFESIELIEDGSKSQSDIPAMATLGMEYQLSPRLKILGTLARYFNSNTEFGPFLGFDITGKVEDDWEAGAGLEWAMSDVQLLSVGHVYFNSGHTDESRTLNRFTLDGHFIGLGGRRQLSDSWDLTTSLLLMLWDETEIPLDRSSTDQAAYVFALESSFWF